MKTAEKLIIVVAGLLLAGIIGALLIMLSSTLEEDRNIAQMKQVEAAKERERVKTTAAACISALKKMNVVYRTNSKGNVTIADIDAYANVYSPCRYVLNSDSEFSGSKKISCQDHHISILKNGEISAY